MKFTNKIKTRIVLNILYLIIGLALITIGNFSALRNESLYTFGAVFTVMGIVRIVQYTRLIKDPEALRNREIAETDERNLMIITQARSIAFSVYISLAGSAVAVCYLMNLAAVGQIIAYCICAYILIYWIVYMIVKKSV